MILISIPTFFQFFTSLFIDKKRDGSMNFSRFDLILYRGKQGVYVIIHILRLNSGRLLHYPSVLTMTCINLIFFLDRKRERERGCVKREGGGWGEERKRGEQRRKGEREKEKKGEIFLIDK